MRLGFAGGRAETRPFIHVGGGTSAARWLTVVVPLLLLSSSLGLITGSVHGDSTPAAPVFISSVVPLSLGSDYPMYLGNVERTSSSSSEPMINLSTAASLHLLWSFNAKQVVQSQVVEENGTAYFGGHTGYEYAVYATNGSLRWKTFLGQDTNDTGCDNILGVTSTATVVGNNLYVDGGYANFYALNSTTGAIEWQAPIGNGTDTKGYYDWSSPLIYGNNAYVGIASDCDQPLVQAGLDEFSLTTHALSGYFDSSAPAQNGSSIWGSPAVNPQTNTVFVATGNQFGNNPPTTYSESVIALNATTLAVEAKWQVPPVQAVGDSDFGVTPTLFTPAGGYPMVTAANKDGFLYAFYQSNLTLAWEQRICCLDSGEDEHISTAWGGGLVYAVSSDTTIGGANYNSSVRAFNPLTGAVVWQDPFTLTSYDGYAAPLWVNQLLIVPDQGTLLVLNATDGALVYQDTLGGVFQAAASIARGELYATSTDHDVYAFDLSLSSSANESIHSGPGPLTDFFNDTGSGGLPPYQYAWTFGDGGTSNLQDPIHTFGTAGTYHITVTTTDLAGNVSTKQLTVVVEPTFNVEFTETGLPAAYAWSVALGGVLQSTNASEIPFSEVNGTYAYSVQGPTGYAATLPSGTVLVNGTDEGVSVTFLSGYPLTFVAEGLPLGTLWNVTIGSLTRNSTTSTIGFIEPKGVYPFLVGVVSGWRTTDSGSVVVTGAGRTVYRLFSEVTYVEAFKEIGLPNGTSWNVTVGSTTVSSTNALVRFTLSDGTYSYSVGNVANYSSPSNGSFSITGTGATIFERFSMVTYAVKMVETGLPSVKNWSVTIGSTTRWSSTNTIVFHLANGSHPYLVANVAGFSRTASGTVTVVGADLTVTTHFATVRYQVIFSESGLPHRTQWQITADSLTYSSLGLTVEFFLPNGTFPYASESSNPDYVGGVNLPPVAVNGSPITVPVVFTNQDDPQIPRNAAIFILHDPSVAGDPAGPTTATEVDSLAAPRTLVLDIGVASPRLHTDFSNDPSPLGNPLGTTNAQSLTNFQPDDPS
ncbi:MAG: PQQ-binding-like beta-propeller repeat protein [Thermoplasmata archaeon]